jgi:hypothetical protein
MFSAKMLLWIGGGIAAAGGVIGIIDYFTPIGIWGLIGPGLAVLGAVVTVWQGLRADREGKQLAAQGRAEWQMMSGRPHYEAIFETMRPHPPQGRKSLWRRIVGG